MATRQGSVLIAYSLADPAGSGAAKALAELAAWEKCSLPRAVSCVYEPRLRAYLASFREDTIYFDFLDEAAPGDTSAYIVLSRHSGGKPTLTVHYTGNPGPEAPYGGRPRELSHTWPRLMAALLREYRRVAEEAGLLEEFGLSLEATHHGPTSLARPVVFIEIGSSENEWKRGDAHQALAQTVYNVLSRGWLDEPCSTVAIGVGDTHYPAKHTRAVLEKGVCYTHIFSKHVLDSLDEELLAQAVEKSRDPVDAVLFSKVPSRVKNLVRGFAEKRGLRVEKA
ncbi:D-aminoacyl-tRNA deacylase [Pyrodictium abyssi]|uniref:D-aminoacyl-tRNA deacylase n=1 Tax=Pyrodictium abyssi TaxID=54256 RepID=A0ABN6ZSM5_9CREN|nr:D-aminoacyl-tRNA deacylase [Pyrodictium abyssi]